MPGYLTANQLFRRSYEEPKVFTSYLRWKRKTIAAWSYILGNKVWIDSEDQLCLLLLELGGFYLEINPRYLTAWKESLG